MQSEDPIRGTKTIIGLIIAGLVVWGVLQAVGAYQFNHNPWRGIVVLACFAGFLTWWLILLRVHSRRVSRAARTEDDLENHP